MMNRLCVLLAALLLGACGERPVSTETAPTETPPTDTVESLLANPARLKELRKQCRINRAELGDELCNIVGEANTRAFLGDGEVPYTPPKEQPAF